MHLFQDELEELKNKEPAPSEFEITMNEFIKFRKDIKKPLTERAKELILKDLEKLAPGDEKTQIAILNQSIKRGWAGVFKLKDAEDVPKAPEPAQEQKPAPSQSRNFKVTNDPGKWAQDSGFTNAIANLMKG